MNTQIAETMQAEGHDLTTPSIENIELDIDLDAGREAPRSRGGWSGSWALRRPGARSPTGRGPRGRGLGPRVALALAVSALLLVAAPWPSVVGAAPVASAWPQFRGGIGLTGTSPGAAPGGTVLYTVDLTTYTGAPLADPLGNDYPYQSSPSTDGSQVVLALDNQVISVAVTNGALLWKHALPGGTGGGPVVGTPLLQSGQVYVAQDGGPNDLVALWASNGSAHWQASVPGGNPVSASPVDLAGSLEIVDTGGGVFSTSDGGYGSWTSPTTIPGGAAYFATPSAVFLPGGGTGWVVPDRGARSLDAYSPSGSMLSGFPVTSNAGGLDRLYSSAALVNLSAPAGGPSATWAIFGGEGGAGAPSHLYAVDVNNPTGVLALTVPNLGTGDSGIRSSPAVVASGSTATVYAGSRNGALISAQLTMTSTSTAVWSWGWNATTQGPIDASPVVVGTEVLVPSEDGSLYAFATSGGGLLWKVPTGSPIYASPAVANGEAWVVNSAGVLTAVGGALMGGGSGNGNGGGNTGGGSGGGTLTAGSGGWVLPFLGGLGAGVIVGALLIFLVINRRHKPARGSHSAEWSESAPPVTTEHPSHPEPAPSGSSAPPATGGKGS